MQKRKFIMILLSSVLSLSLLSFYGCQKNTNASTTNNEISNTTETNTEDNQLVFDKKYYSLNDQGYVKDEYYTFNQNGTASYTHIMQRNNNVTFHQIINFKWAYAEEGTYILIHNGTKMLVGIQDDVFGFSRVMHVTKNVIYWSGSGDNTYFICEDFVDEIPNYAKFI